MAIRAEGQYTAVMVRKGLIEVDQYLLTARVGLIAIRLVARNYRIAVCVGIVDVEVRVVLEARMERQAQEALLAADTPHLFANIEERVARRLAILENQYTACLLKYEHAARAVIRKLDISGRGNA